MVFILIFVNCRPIISVTSDLYGKRALDIDVSSFFLCSRGLLGQKHLFNCFVVQPLFSRALLKWSTLSSSVHQDFMIPFFDLDNDLRYFSAYIDFLYIVCPNLSSLCVTKPTKNVILSSVSTYMVN